VDAVLDKVVNWIVAQAKRVGRAVAGGVGRRQGREEEAPNARLAGAIAAVRQLMVQPEKEEESVEAGIPQDRTAVWTQITNF
jgi:hypothetical protein